MSDGFIRQSNLSFWGRQLGNGTLPVKEGAPPKGPDAKRTDGRRLLAPWPFIMYHGKVGQKGQAEKRSKYTERMPKSQHLDVQKPQIRAESKFLVTKADMAIDL